MTNPIRTKTRIRVKVTIVDMFRGLLFALDPVVSSFRHNKPKLKSDFPAEVLDLLIFDDDDSDDDE